MKHLAVEREIKHTTFIEVSKARGKSSVKNSFGSCLMA